MPPVLLKGRRTEYTLMARYTQPLPNEETAFAELADIIEILPRFALVFAICASDAAAIEHISKFQAIHPHTHITHVSIDWPDGRIYTRLKEVYDTQHPDAIFVTGMEAWTERAEDALGNEFTNALNIGRDYLHENVPCPVVFWCTPVVYNHIRRNAHDFYSIATATLRLSLPDPDSNALYDNYLTLDGARSLSALERKERISELSALIDNTDNVNEKIRFLDILGGLYYIEGRIDDAYKTGTEALSLADSAQMSGKYEYAHLLHSLAFIEHAMGRDGEARTLYRRALAIEDAILGRNHPNTAGTLGSLAQIERSLGNLSEARALLEETLAILTMTLGRQHPNTATTISTLAGLEREVGRYSEARSLLEEALAIKESTLGNRHSSTAITLGNLGYVEFELGNFATARYLWEEALLIFEASVGRTTPDSATTLHYLSRLAFQMGNLREAQNFAEQSISIYEKTLGVKHASTESTYRLLSSIYQAQGDLKRAAEMAEKAGGTRPAVPEPPVLVPA